MLSAEELTRLKTFKKHKSTQGSNVSREKRTGQIDEEMDYWKKKLLSVHTSIESNTYLDKLIKLRAEQAKLLLEEAYEEDHTEEHIERVIRAYYYDCAQLVTAATVL